MKIVDASAIIAILFDEPERAAIEPLLANQDLVAPVILPFEITNTCATYARQFPKQEGRYADALIDFFGWSITLRNVDQGGTFALARKHNLSAYDASYLWLARELGVELVTLDERLEKARLRE